MENLIQTRDLITGVAGETGWNNTKFEYKRDVSNSKLDQEHNKNSEKGMMTVGWSVMWHSAVRVKFSREHPT